MKKTYLYLMLAAVVACGCAKTPSTGLNDAAKRYFDAWIHVNHPDAKPTELGSYIIEEQVGTGAVAGDADDTPYVLADYTLRGLDGTVQETTSELVAQQVGTYDPADFYGPEVWQRGGNALPASLDEVVSGMRVGGTVKFATPGWLQTNSRYDDAKGYLANVSGTPVIYEVALRELISDVKKWEADSIGRYLDRHFPAKSPSDSLGFGFYYIQTGAPSSDRTMPTDTTIYINYTGRLLDGTVFDTTIKDTAKFYGIYSASRTYGPVSVEWYSASEDDEDYSDITMSSSSIIEGFAFTLYQMHPHEKGMGIFTSNWGYKADGSGSTIPGFSPLRFDVEIVDKP